MLAKSRRPAAPPLSNREESALLEEMKAVPCDRWKEHDGGKAAGTQYGLVIPVSGGELSILRVLPTLATRLPFFGAGNEGAVCKDSRATDPAERGCSERFFYAVEERYIGYRRAAFEKAQTVLAELTLHPEQAQWQNNGTDRFTANIQGFLVETDRELIRTLLGPNFCYRVTASSNASHPVSVFEQGEVAKRVFESAQAACATPV